MLISRQKRSMREQGKFSMLQRKSTPEIVKIGYGVIASLRVGLGARSNDKTKKETYTLLLLQTG